MRCIAFDQVQQSARGFVDIDGPVQRVDGALDADRTSFQGRAEVALAECGAKRRIERKSIAPSDVMRVEAEKRRLFIAETPDANDKECTGENQQHEDRYDDVHQRSVLEEQGVESIHGPGHR